MMHNDLSTSSKDIVQSCMSTELIDNMRLRGEITMMMSALQQKEYRQPLSQFLLAIKKEKDTFTT